MQGCPTSVEIVARGYSFGRGCQFMEMLSGKPRRITGLLTSSKAAASLLLREERTLLSVLTKFGLAQSA